MSFAVSVDVHMQVLPDKTSTISDEVYTRTASYAAMILPQTNTKQAESGRKQEVPINF